LVIVVTIGVRLHLYEYLLSCGRHYKYYKITIEMKNNERSNFIMKSLIVQA
jgi:hypothetical protein